MNIEQALIIAHELKTEFKIGNWSHFIGETSFDETTDIEIAEIILNTMNAAEQKMHPTLGDSAASDSESKPAPERLI